MLDTSNTGQDGLQKFTWTCPREGCKKYIMSWTEKGLLGEKARHLDAHFRDDKDRVEASIIEFASRPPKTPAEYEKIVLTMEDVCFLKTRGIKVEETMEIHYVDRTYRKR